MTASDQAETLNTPPTDPSAPQQGAAAKGADAKAAPTPSIEEQLATAKKEATDNYDRYLRLAADMENLRRRTSDKMSRILTKRCGAARAHFG